MFLDTYSGQPKFFVTTINQPRQLVAHQAKTAVPRPVNVDSRHCYITPDQVADYQDAWDFYRSAA